MRFFGKIFRMPPEKVVKNFWVSNVTKTHWLDSKGATHNKHFSDVRGSLNETNPNFVNDGDESQGIQSVKKITKRNKSKQMGNWFYGFTWPLSMELWSLQAYSPLWLFSSQVPENQSNWFPRSLPFGLENPLPSSKVSWLFPWIWMSQDQWLGYNPNVFLLGSWNLCINVFFCWGFGWPTTSVSLWIRSRNRQRGPSLQNIQVGWPWTPCPQKGPASDSNEPLVWCGGGADRRWDLNGRVGHIWLQESQP